MSQPEINDALLQAISTQVRAELVPLANAIDQQGVYPEAYLRKLGALGGFGAAIPVASG